jgi:23S rRNA (uracil1939-C5)-methyltransferase
MPADTFDISLTTLVYGGYALGRLPEGSSRPGLAVFVPGALPGERVRVRLVDEKRGHARADLLEVLTPSPERIFPRCPHFFTPLSSVGEGGEGDVAKLRYEVGCGGCHYQHLAYPAQLAAKTAILGDQLERLGGVASPPIRPILPSPEAWNYRNHVQFHLAPSGRLGFQALHTNQVVPVRECHLPESSINQLWPQLDLEPLPGLERVSLRVGADEDLMLILEGGDPQTLGVIIEELPISAVHLSPAGTLVLAGSEYILMEVGANVFRVSAESFFQVNTPQAGAMATHLLASLPLSVSTTLLDVYCGVGLFSAFLAPRVGRLIGIEASPSACRDFECNLDAFDNVELYEATAEQVLPALDLRPDVILVDPPRAGLGPTVLDGLLALRAPILVYVSCDPATLGRDTRRLVAGGYCLRQITPFDLFPQTYHIESISCFEG